MSDAPVYDIDLAAFNRDPVPNLAEMMRKAPIAFVPQLGATLMTRRETIFVQEKRIDVFSAEKPDGPLSRLMGANMMRKERATRCNCRSGLGCIVPSRDLGACPVWGGHLDPGL